MWRRLKYYQVFICLCACMYLSELVPLPFTSYNYSIRCDATCSVRSRGSQRHSPQPRLAMLGFLLMVRKSRSENGLRKGGPRPVHQQQRSVLYDRNRHRLIESGMFLGGEEVVVVVMKCRSLL